MSFVMETNEHRQIYTVLKLHDCACYILALSIYPVQDGEVGEVMAHTRGQRGVVIFRQFVPYSLT